MNAATPSLTITIHKLNFSKDLTQLDSVEFSMWDNDDAAMVSIATTLDVPLIVFLVEREFGLLSEHKSAFQRMLEAVYKQLGNDYQDIFDALIDESFYEYDELDEVK